jgi:hypothetical protein
VGVERGTELDSGMIAAMEGPVLEDLLRQGEEAIVAADWERARACLEEVLARHESPDALIGLSKVAMISPASSPSSISAVAPRLPHTPFATARDGVETSGHLGISPMLSRAVSAIVRP